SRARLTSPDSANFTSTWELRLANRLFLLIGSYKRAQNHHVTFRTASLMPMATTVISGGERPDAQVKVSAFTQTDISASGYSSILTKG
ncbi:hypothetical protein PN445_10210, partial [Dolichospermum circinale CS-537/11]